MCVGSTLVYIGSTFGHIGSTQGYVGSIQAQLINNYQCTNNFSLKKLNVVVFCHFGYFGSTLGYVGSTLEYIKSTLVYDGYVGSTLGYIGSALACIVFSSIQVNNRSTFGHFGSTLGYVGSTLEYMGSTLWHSEFTYGYVGNIYAQKNTCIPIIFAWRK